MSGTSLFWDIGVDFRWVEYSCIIGQAFITLVSPYPYPYTYSYSYSYAYTYTYTYFDSSIPHHVCTTYMCVHITSPPVVLENMKSSCSKDHSLSKQELRAPNVMYSSFLIIAHEHSWPKRRAQYAN